MKLTELNPRFVIPDADYGSWLHTEDIQAAKGIIFLCPVCFAANRGPEGTHSVVCWRPSVPQSPKLTGPGRWDFQGSRYADLTLVAGSSSVKLNGGCNAHFFVKNGEIQILP